MDFTCESTSLTLNFNNCRCCMQNEGSTDISEEYTFIPDKKEVYETMLKDTFDIQINHHPYIGRKICNVCISKLRDAAAFRHQILDAETALIYKYKELANVVNKSLRSSEVNKYEITDDNMDGDVDVKEEIDDEDFYDDDLGGKELDTKLEPIKADKLPSRKNITKDVTRRIKNRKKKINRKHTDADESSDKSLADLRDVSLKLVLNSNMCIFKSQKTKFACTSCPESYLDIKELKEHSKAHYVNGQPNINFNKCTGLTYKYVDISGLACKKCMKQCKDLNFLREHLASEHGVKFNGSEHMLVPFKLEDGFTCVLCRMEFQTFCRLSIHMNTHSTRNVCEICGAAYTNRISLRNHLRHIHKTHSCSICSAELPNKSAKERHMRKAHKIGANSKRHCLKCDMTFRYAHLLKKHMIEAHGAATQTVECEHCGKKFPSAYALKVHTRAVHIKERNYPCETCDMRFFTSHDKKRHELKHGSEKTFICHLCEVKFTTKDSMRRHLGRQHGVHKVKT